jgi:hypothetical protein
MTSDEFDRWANEFFIAFPGTLAWLKRTSPDQEATMGVWLRTLARTSLADALEAIDRLIDGRAAPIGDFQEDRTAIHVAAIAARSKGERQKAAEQSRMAVEAESKRDGWPGMAAAVRAGLRAKADRRSLATQLGVPEHKAMTPAEFMLIYDGYVIEEFELIGLHDDARSYLGMRRAHGAERPKRQGELVTVASEDFT